MPRSRRRHHSRSRSRSRSHSHDRDRDTKRRKIDSVDSPPLKRSVSEEESEEMSSMNNSQNEEILSSVEESKIESVNNENEILSEKSDNSNTSKIESVKQHLEEKLTITPKKAASPKNLQKKLESEKKRQQRQSEKEERERKKQEEKERIRLEKEKVKQEKEEQLKKKNKQKAKEKELKEELKRKEREEKEAKRREREEREEVKRKERELEKQRKQQEIDEKNKEKLKLEEQKQKAAAAFVNFFVTKKPETKVEEELKICAFMPFQVKSDMRLPPLRRVGLKDEEKDLLVNYLGNVGEEASYLKDLKNGKKVGKCGKTWPFEEDIIIVEEDFGTSICEDKPKLMKMRAKFLKFHENKRPPYYGTWRKTSKVVKSRKPLGEDKDFFDYEVDSDDDWEEEEQGESLNGSDDEDKENEAEDDYEVDNEFFVPHGHLSDDEVDDEASAKLSPESHKQKLKLLKDEFDQDMQTKTNKMKPRSIGCIWYNKDGSNVDEAIDRHLRPLSIITNGQIIIKKRNDVLVSISMKKHGKDLPSDLIPVFLKLINGNVNKRTVVVEEFINYMQNNGFAVEVSKTHLGKRLKEFAQWKKCLDQGPMYNKFCWCLESDVKKKYNIV